MHTIKHTYWFDPEGFHKLDHLDGKVQELKRVLIYSKFISTRIGTLIEPSHHVNSGYLVFKLLQMHITKTWFQQLKKSLNTHYYKF